MSFIGLLQELNQYLLIIAYLFFIFYRMVFLMLADEFDFILNSFNFSNLNIQIK